MPWIIDAHEDLAWNFQTFARDYRRASTETRALEAGSEIPQLNGDTMLGWPDYQRGQVALVFGTLFLTPKRYQRGEWDHQSYADFNQARRLYQAQADIYHRWNDETPDYFRLVTNRSSLQAVLAPWDESPADYPKRTHPVGVVMLLEGAEGVGDPREMEMWWQAGVRIVGPVWAGTRYCGGTREHGSFTRQGYELLEIMAGLGMTLDISHMDNQSALQALDAFPGWVIASHANARAIIKDVRGERHLTDDALRRLIERDGVVGVVPFNPFLRADWRSGDPRSNVPLDMVAAQIDYICQIAGNAKHVGLGTDFDGGIGWPDVPEGLESISDMQHLASQFQLRGYSDADIAAVFGGNWRRHLERALPAS
ncbi:MAG TPA: membrane dipeptidase [Anaerolineaceae bacterium]|nr:membrane dipeptidase [Anaerolineaceae bacterium]